MSLNLKNLGWWKTDNEYAHKNNTVVLPTTTGTTIVVVADSNAPEPFAVNNTYGDGTDSDMIRVFEIDAAFTTATQVATYTFGGGLLEKPFEISADLYEDNSVGVAVLRSTGLIQYRKITYGTWAVGTAESVVTLTAAQVRQIDVSISSADVPVVAVIETAAANPKAVLKTYARAATGGAWVAGTAVNLMTTADPNNSMFSLSVQFGRAGTASARPVSVIVSNAQLDGPDAGHRVYTAVLAESTGALSTWTLRKTYLAGNMTTKWGTFCRRSYLFNSTGSEITVAIMEAADKRTLLIARYTWDGTTWTETLAPQTSDAKLGTIDKLYRFAASYANDRVNFYYISEFKAAYPSPINYVAFIDRVANSVRYSGYFRWDNMENTGQDRLYPMAGTGKNAYRSNARHACIFFGVNSNGLWHVRAHDVKAAPAPTNLSPVDATQVPSATPELSFRANLGKKWPQSRHKAVWELATNLGFTANLRRFEQPDDKFVKIENTEVSTAYAYFADVLPLSQALTSGTWYVRGALFDEFGITGAWTGVNSFTLLHPPSAINRQPNSGSTLETGNVQFLWDFSDPSPTDTQSAFQIVVENNDTGAVIYDSGKVISSLGSHLISLSSTYQGVLLRWKIRLWDSDDTVGEYSPYDTFTVAGPPTVVINSPTNGSTVTSGTPRILFTPTTTGSHRVARYQVTISKSGVVVRDSGVVSVDSASGVQLSWRSDGELLEDGAVYSATVVVGDDTGLTGSATVPAFTVDYVLPAGSAGLGVSTANYNVDDLGYVSVSWNDSTRDADFEAWVVSRRDNEVAMDGVTVVEVGQWEEVYRVTAPAASYLFKDYYAPSGHKVDYKVQQLVDRNGDMAISGDGTIVSAYPKSDGYWLIEPDSDSNDAVAFRLHNVTQDDYTDEYEETEFNIIGRGRHIDSGDELGVRGTLSAQLRNTGTTTARQKKRQLETARAAKVALRMRNPFGDVYTVRVGNLGISRLAGVGKEEFVDVSVPYSEVAE